MYNSFSSYLYYEILDAVSQRVMIHDYVMQARADQEEVDKMNGIMPSPDEPKSPGSPQTMGMDLNFSQKALSLEG